MAQQETRRLSAAGVSTWIFVDQRRKWLGIGLHVALSSGASLTYSVQHSFDNLRAMFTDFTATRVTTTVTVTKVNHGLSVGDYVYQEGVGAPMDGEHTVASVADLDTFTYTVANSGVTSAPNSRMATARVFPNATLALLTASADGNYMFPPAVIRLKISTYGSGFADLTVIQQGA